jgi:hypothetical protein
MSEHKVLITMDDGTLEYNRRLLQDCDSFDEDSEDYSHYTPAQLVEAWSMLEGAVTYTDVTD